jgi:hypothetical protein
VRVLDVLDVDLPLAVVGALGEVVLRLVGDPLGLLGVGAVRGELVEHGGAVDRVGRGGERVAVVGLDRGLDLVEVLDLAVAGGSDGRGRYRAAVATAAVGERKAGDGEGGRHGSGREGHGGGPRRPGGEGEG